MERAGVRALGPPDWQVLRELRLAALATDPDAFYSSLIGAQRQPEQFWRDWPRDGVAFGAWYEPRPGVPAEPGGMVGVAVNADDPAQADLFAMWVAPAARGS